MNDGFVQTVIKHRDCVCVWGVCDRVTVQSFSNLLKCHTREFQASVECWEDHTHTHQYTHTHTHTHTSTHTHTHTHTSTHTHQYTHTHTHQYTHQYTHTHTPVHTHTSTQTNALQVHVAFVSYVVIRDLTIHSTHDSIRFTILFYKMRFKTNYKLNVTYYCLDKMLHVSL